MKKHIIMLFTIFSLFFFPSLVYAYSNEIIVGGDTIGIHIDSDGILVIGFYKVEGKYQKGSPEIKVGDVIVGVGNTKVTSIAELTKAIDENLKDNTVTVMVKRDNNRFTSTLFLSNIDGVYKTGLYVKDGISGIGTLTYIDPGTKIFGTLGHEIIESNSSKRIEVKTGTIFDSTVSKITKSTNGSVGEKNADLHYDDVFGTIKKNTYYGVFGDYTATLPSGKKFVVGKPDEVKVGKASIYTVLSDNQVKEYEIMITNINHHANIKNITFEITDEGLLKETGGVIQGMSGSPILQNGKIIGAVTHAIVDDVKNGYGVFITTMLEEGER